MTTWQLRTVGERAGRNERGVELNARLPKPRVYRGAVVFPAGLNASGIRWTARTDSGERLRADTLAGIKELIRRKAQ